MTARTDSSKERTSVPEVIGDPIPAAIFCNYEGYGYAKFIIDDVSMKTFREHLNKIESEYVRKHIYLTMWDMVKSNRLAGSSLLSIIETHIKTEESEDVVRTCF